MHHEEMPGEQFRVRQVLQNVTKYSAFLGAAICVLFAADASAITQSYSGTLTGDDQIKQILFSNPSTATLTFSTNSYGGGMFNGITTPSGGFVPVLSLFNALSGNLIGSNGGDATCSLGMTADPGTSLCNDASLTLTLAPGNYTLAVTEFFNVPVGPNISDGFLQQGQGNFTGSTCGTSGSFYEADLAPCAQRTGNYNLNVASVVPEPSALWTAVPALLFGLSRLRKK